MGFLLLLAETAARQPATVTSVKQFLAQLSLAVPAAADPKFVTADYVSSDAIPMQLLIELKTMKLVHAKAGGLSTVTPVIQAFFSK